jgi:chorismate-pyruvate lyase
MMGLETHHLETCRGQTVVQILREHPGFEADQLDLTVERLQARNDLLYLRGNLGFEVVVPLIVDDAHGDRA